MRNPVKLPKVAAAMRTLVSLHKQADALRLELLGLKDEIAKVQRTLSGELSSQIVAANENLVLAALRAESVAETAVGDLEELARTSQHDVLTDTPNRALMRDRMESAIAMARRHGASFAIIFVDLDRFKEINDTMGHTVGDEVVKMVARRLESVVRNSDTVSRHGGDEFLVLLTEIKHDSDAAVIAEKMLVSLAAPSRIGKELLTVSASLGIALYPKDGEDAETLISRADAAMYQVKKRGGGSFEFYRAEPSGQASPMPTAETQHEFLLSRPQPPFHEMRQRDRRQGNSADRRHYPGFPRAG